MPLRWTPGDEGIRRIDNLGTILGDKEVPPCRCIVAAMENPLYSKGMGLLLAVDATELCHHCLRNRQTTEARGRTEHSSG